MRIKTKIKKYVNRLSSDIIAEHKSRAAAIYDNQNINNYLSNSKALTEYEKEKIKEIWSPVIKNIPRGYNFFKGMKSLDTFNPLYLPSSYFYPYIENILNPKEWKYQLANKSMLELIFGNHVKHPHTVLRSFGGAILDNNYRCILPSQTSKIICKINQPLLFKPAVDSEQGSGIKLITPDAFSRLIKDIESGVIFSKYREFVLQIPVKQSEQTSLFNPTSLNCVRITSININDVVSIGSKAIKCGPKDSVVDNIGSGRRGVMVGIEANGHLKDIGFYGNGDIAYEHNGEKFASHKIQHFYKIEETAIRLHSLVSKCKIIGWDIALDDTNEPILIESNTCYPGISLEQMCSGPIFGERTSEVVEYVLGRKKRY